MKDFYEAHGKRQKIETKYFRRTGIPRI